jgi:protein phosphatase
MGTTIALLSVVEDFAVVAHIGDSRVYLLRGGDLRALTRDHSVLGKDLGPAPVASGPGGGPAPRRKKKYITRALGTREAARPDVQTLEVVAGDRFLLCSDGLTDLVGDPEIQAVLDSAGDRLDSVPDVLVDLANARGGRDNVTVIVAEVEDPSRSGRRAALQKAPPPVHVVPVSVPVALDEGAIEDLDLLIEDDDEDDLPPPPPFDPPPAWDPD